MGPPPPAHPKTTTKKDHVRLNNPFQKAVPSASLRHSDAAPPLSFAPASKLARGAHDFPVGTHFRLRWDPSLGGVVSLARVPSSGDPSSRRGGRGGGVAMWETVPGVAFVSAASVDTEADECRGSFALRDGRARLVPDRQRVDRISALYRCDVEAGADLLRGAAFQESERARFPVVVITGLVSARKASPSPSCFCGRRRAARRRATGRPVLSARYWLLLEEKSDTQVAFSVKLGDYQWSCDHDAHPPRPPLSPSPSPSSPSPKSLRSGSSLRLRLAARLQRSSSKKKKKISVREDLVALLPAQAAPAAEEEFNRVFVTLASARDERFYGFGEQFSRVEFKGRRVPVLVQEQGIGRGDQPITFAANLVSYRSGGNWSTTYAPSPFYMTSKMRSLYLEGYDYSIFDLTKPDRVQIQVYGSSVQGRILHGESPTELITSYTESTGRPPVLPRWITSGAVVGMQGGTDAVRRVWNQLQDHDVPISAFWLQDWVGQRRTSIGSQLWWNWEVDDDHYAGWKDLTRDLRRRGVRTMTYCNPCLVPMDQKANAKRHLFEEAKKLGILVRDAAGEPYMIPNTAFDVAMLDFTNPEARAWFKEILAGMAGGGAAGWMADFGEGLPLDARLHSGEDPVAAHNRYPELWARVNREFADEWRSGMHRRRGGAGDADEQEEDEGLVFFVRAGFRESSRWAMLFWEGDQMVSWQANDGIKSSVVGLLSGGLSGFPLNHSDAGGYCTVDLPLLRYRRSEELLLRWMELSAFTVVFRTHEGNKPGSNCQFYSNSRTLAHFARCAKIYKAWEFYRIQLVEEAAKKGLPVARHLFLHYPEDRRVQKMAHQQFLVGTELLVVPVLDKGRSTVAAYFPAASDGAAWRHVWTGDELGGGGCRSCGGGSGAGEEGVVRGFEAEVEARIGFPAVFVRVGSPVGERFMSNLRDLKVL
ncbi:sulfoquinovosidase-like [Oryza brachyantha]|uniref:sulfoquinovosidase-like n=1 Tax=Oryza brachyantha TaxID=4533 RepID=UPI001ADBA42E|nr:sulfoquinovosidase-like [Oryza brachyantha]